MTSTIQETGIPTGAWNADTVHSSVGFEVPYAVNTFTGSITDFDAKLEDGKLKGAARIATITVKDENLEAHLLSPEFFDAASHPEIRFETSEVRRDGDRVEADAELTIKGITRPVRLDGTITGPAVDHFGSNRVGLKLETTVDRTEFDMNWNMPLPTGEPALSNEVTLKADLTLVGA
jgi:polyisoprenoid-binding protein YceI